ncbi:hypothetical protein H6P81_016673 [Aristolochia fimbriata]|uniref:Uncharacterized protein n=1 Tax=Aristolochia fimbriata TaxID=158543 RepID=A0AAV7E9D3_ARIFI|nr:hypothetical protein H6P81_016673 [Aristolochia fimbriata]
MSFLQTPLPRVVPRGFCRLVFTLPTEIFHISASVNGRNGFLRVLEEASFGCITLKGHMALCVSSLLQLGKLPASAHAFSSDNDLLE